MSGSSTRWAIHLLCYGLLAFILLGALGQRVRRPHAVGACLRIDEAEVRPMSCRLDPNVANWPELACLPGIGPTLARRIVDFREEGRVSAGTAAAKTYRTPEDLLAVRDIGPKRLARIRPYLKFP